ncbi:MAG TPA: HAMP domain-containing sensor histidine kinase [Candidatus Woesebacteria bacterium]|nr:HAMP domain-containing sensor histidine kinase [Candidatus Woesebacteria bacterium]
MKWLKIKKHLYLLLLGVISHELKNPLTTVYGYASIIIRQLKKGKAIDPKTGDMLITEIQRMSQLIDELLNTKNSNLEKGKLKYSKKAYSFSKLIKNTVTTWKVANTKHTILFTCKKAIYDLVYIDTQKLRQVVINILNNAAKFSPENSEITINLDNRDKQIICRISDQGKGIEKKDIKNIFKRFYKGQSGEKKEGMGLGLYLCKQIVEDHHGTISVSSVSGKGTMFSIVIPCYVN